MPIQGARMRRRPPLLLAYLLAVLITLSTVVGYRPQPTVPVQSQGNASSGLSLSDGFLRWALGEGMPTLGLVRPVPFAGLSVAGMTGWLFEVGTPVVPGDALSILSTAMPSIGAGYTVPASAPGSWPSVAAISPSHPSPSSPAILRIGASPVVAVYETNSRDSFWWAVSKDSRNTSLTPVSDKSQDTVAAVGRTFARALGSDGVDAVHSSYVNDAQGMLGAYVRSAETARSLLKSYPTVRFLVDVDRSPAPVGTVKEGSGRAARVSIVVGTSDLLPSPGWTKNLALAKALAADLEYVAPGILVAVATSPDRLNQEILPGGSLTVEIGGTNSTMSEEKTAARFLAQAFSDLVKGGAGR